MIFVFVLGAAVAGLVAFGVIDEGDLPGRSTPDQDVEQDDGSVEGPWSDSKPKKELYLVNGLNQTVESGEIYVLREKPESAWRNQDIQDSDLDDVRSVGVFSVSSDAVTLQLPPGRYYYVASSQGSYTGFGEFRVPDGSNRNESLTEYNEEPERKYILLDSRYNVSGRDLDIGVRSSTDSRTKWSTGFTVEPSHLTEYRPSKIVFETGGVDITEYSLSSGDCVEDGEGIQEIELRVSGAVQDSYTVFNPCEGVDRFGVSDSFVYNFRDRVSSDFVLRDDESLRFDFYVVTSYTSTSGRGEGDGILTDGENFLDFTLVDASGRSTPEFELYG